MKSNGGNGKPACGINAAMKPPKQQSTWTGILYLRPKADIASISSDVPYGKLGNDPTSCKYSIQLLIINNNIFYIRIINKIIGQNFKYSITNYLKFVCAKYYID